MNLSREIYDDRVLGCLLGGACGDALGYQVEFFSLREILKLHGPEGVRGPLKDVALEASDDTQMTLFTAEGIAKAYANGETDLVDIAFMVQLSYLNWYATQGQSTGGYTPTGRLFADRRLHRRQAPGNTCLSSLRGIVPDMLVSSDNDSKGNGGVMRVAPVGLTPVLGREDVFRLGEATALITHGHREGYVSAGAMASIIHDLLNGETLEEAALTAAGLASQRMSCKTARLLELAVSEKDQPLMAPREMTNMFGEAWVGEEALGLAVYAAIKGKDFADAISIAATHSGDSDSTASICGQILGVRDGTAAIPREWIDELDLKEPVEETAAQFIEAFYPSEETAPPKPDGKILSGFKRLIRSLSCHSSYQ